jgi:hypothetical protein
MSPSKAASTLHFLAHCSRLGGGPSRDCRCRQLPPGRIVVAQAPSCLPSPARATSPQPHHPREPAPARHRRTSQNLFAASTHCVYFAIMSYETDNYDQRDRSPRRRSRSPRRSRRSYSPRSRSRSREDYRRTERRSRSPQSGAQGAGGYQSYGAGRGASSRPVENKGEMMQSIRDSSQQDRRVYVGNLSYDVKWHHLKDFMRQGTACAAPRQELG